MSTTSRNGGRLTFGFDLKPRPDSESKGRRSGDEPFRILLLADLSGRAQRNIEDATDLGSRPCLRVDVDTYDSILMKYAPRLDWPIGRFDFKTMDDFHPDQIYQRVEVFKALRETRAGLDDPSTASDMLRKLRTEAPMATSPEEPTADTPREGDIFNRLLKRTSEPIESSPPAPTQEALSGIIRRIVAPYILPAADPRIDKYLASVDMAIGDQMRAILHHRDFQALEATWRGIRDLVTGLELDENLELFVLDVTKQELLADLRTHMTDLTASGLHRQWVDNAIGGPGGHPWSLIVGHYEFTYREEDIGLLAALGLLAAHARAPFIADADASLIGCKSLAQTPAPSEWDSDLPLFNELRKSMVSPWIGLAAPRILMRLPYGEKSDEIDAFPFEELGKSADHEHFLWGSSAVACARLLGMAFQARGWSFTLGDCLDLDDLPAYTVDTEDGKALKPCAEIVMSDRIGEEISRRGLMAIMSYRHRNAVKIRNIQSISDPPTALSGPWE
jgi:type VI secretion system protein ImpC